MSLRRPRRADGWINQRLKHLRDTWCQRTTNCLEHLHLLATHHQRSLAPLSASLDSPAQEAVSPAPLPATLLAVPETLEALQAQISALQQQIAALTHLLQHPPAPPAIPPAPPEKRRSRPARATLPPPKAPPVAKAPRKPVHVIARIEYRADGGYAVIFLRRVCSHLSLRLRSGLPG